MEASSDGVDVVEALSFLQNLTLFEVALLALGLSAGVSAASGGGVIAESLRKHELTLFELDAALNEQELDAALKELILRSTFVICLAPIFSAAILSPMPRYVPGKRGVAMAL